MKIYDVSLTISPDMPIWPGDPRVSLERFSDMDTGVHANVSRLALGVHTGTHVDAPNHFLNDDRTVEKLPLDALIGPALVVCIPDEVEVINASVLEQAGIPAGIERLLLKTKNSQLWQRNEKEFFQGFVGLSVDGADWLVGHGMKLIGVDYLSIAPYKQSGPTHLALLKVGMVIVEGLDLSNVPEGRYDFYCLPLKLAKSDGAPARAILIGK